MASIYAPIAYVGILIGSMLVFSRIYRGRRTPKPSQMQRWLGPNHARDIYLTLLHMESGAPANAVKAALLMRATSDISQLIDMNQKKQVLAKLVEQGSVGENLVAEFADLEMEMRSEMDDVVAEANALVPEWGRFIVASAAEVHQNLSLRAHVRAISSVLPAQVAAWDELRAHNEARAAALRDSATKELLQDE